MLTQDLRTTLPRPWWRFKMPKRLLQHWHKLLQHFLGQPFGGSCSHLAERATQAHNHLAILWQSWLACRVVVVYSDALQVCCVDTARALTTWARRWSPLPLSSCLIFLFTCLGSLCVSTHANHFFFFLLVVDEADKEPSRYLMYCDALHGSRQTIPMSVAACEVLATAYCILWSSGQAGTSPLD